MPTTPPLPPSPQPLPQPIRPPWQPDRLHDTRYVAPGSAEAAALRAEVTGQLRSWGDLAARTNRRFSRRGC